MSMLAERREKKKWSVDPRGTNWSRDENKFGMKMLQKMGWTKGKGLGAHEDGNTEHVKIKHKADTRGVGCSLKYEKNWVAHQDDFASLLANLNNHHAEENAGSGSEKEVASLEKNSKTQKRVHYQKFARGKDLSNYKSSDLDAIFGKTKAQSAPVTPLNLSENEASDEESNKKYKIKNKKSSKEQPEGNHITAQISIQEYFAQRMALLKKSASTPSSPVAKDDNIDNSEQSEQEKSYIKTKSKKKKIDSEVSLQKKEKSSKKKLKRKKESKESSNAEKDSISEKKKKKKLKKRKLAEKDQTEDPVLLKKSKTSSAQ